MKSKLTRHGLALCASIAALFIPAKGMAADAIFIGSAGDHNLTTGSNWFGGSPAGDWDRLIFGGIVNNAVVPVVDGTLNINNFNGRSGITLTSGLTQDITIQNNQPLIMGAVLSDGFIDMSAATHNLTINTQYWDWSAIEWNVGAGATLFVNGGIYENGSHSLTKDGAGNAWITAAGNRTGTTAINGGALVALRSTLGTGAVTINNGGTLYVNEQWVLCGVNGFGVAEQNVASVTVNAGGTLALDGGNGYANGATNLYLNGGSVTGGNNAQPFGGLYLYNGNEQITAGGATTSTISTSLGLTGNNNTITVDAGSALNITNVLKDGAFDGGAAGGFIKAGAGTLTLSGANSYTGTTTISGGTLEIGGAGTLGNGSYAGDISNNGTLLYSSSANQTLSGFITGSGSITMSGSGTLTLTQTFNDYPTHYFNGAITVNSGTLIAPNEYFGLNPTSITVNGGTLNMQTRPSELGYLALNGGTVTSTGVENTSFGNIILYTDTTVHAGGAAVSTISVNQVKLRGTNGFDVGAGSTLNLTSEVGEYGGAGSLNKTGAGTLTLSGANTYSGGTTVNGGTLLLTGSAASVTSATTINSGGTLAFNLANGTNSSPITLNNGGTLADFNPNGFLVLPGAVNTSGSTAINITSNATGGFGQGFYLDGGLQGTGTVTITATNAGNAVNLRNNNTSFSGTLIVNGIASTTPYAGSGIGVGGGSTGLTNADITLNGTMELNNDGIGWANSPSSTFQMGALNGTGVIVGNSSGGTATTVTLGNTGNNGSFSGTIADGSGNVTSIVKTGAGTQTFSGANTYTGGTTISAGTLKVTNGGALGSGNVAIGGAGALTFDTSGGSYNLNGTTITGTGTMNVTGGNTLVFGGSGPVNVNLSAGAQINLQSGYLESSGSFNGHWTNNQASLDVASGAVFGLKENQVVVDALTGSGTVRQNHPLIDGNTSSLVVGIANGSGTFSGVIQDSVGAASLFKTGTGTQTLSGNNTYTGTTTVNNGTLALLGAGANLSASTTVTVNAGGHLWFQAPSDGSGPFNYNNFALNLTGQGAGLKVGGNNNDSATVFFGNNNGNTYNLGGNVTVAGGVSFATYGIYNTVNFGGVFSGTGDMSFSSSGLVGHTFAFSGDSSASGYTGTYKIYGYYIDAKAQLIGGNNRLPTTATVDLEGVNGGIASLDLNGYSQQLAGLVAGSTTDRVMNSGGGTPVLTINNAAAGSFAGQLGTGGTNFAFTKSGAGTFTLSGANTYTGTTTISEGTLQLNVDGSAGTLTGDGPIVINNGGTLLGGATDALGFFNNTANNTITINQGGTLNVLSSNRLSMDRNLTVTGGTITSQGAGDGFGTYLMRNFAGASYNFTSALDGTASVFSAQNISIHGSATFNVTQGGGPVDLNVSGNLQDVFATPGTLVKTGNGVMVLSGANTYTGATTINAGTLLIGGSASITSNTTVNDASLNVVGTVMGTVETNGISSIVVSGTISGSTTVNSGGTLAGDVGTLGNVTVKSGGTLSPGGSATGSLTVNGDLELEASSNFNVQFDTGAGYVDAITLNGNLTITTGALLNVSDISLAPVPIEYYGSPTDIITYSGTWTGGTTFLGLSDDSTFTSGGITYLISYNDLALDNINHAVTLTIVPEPGAAMSLLGGLGLLLGVRRRRA